MFGPFEYRTSPVFGWLLYFLLFCYVFGKNTIFNRNLQQTKHNTILSPTDLFTLPMSPVPPVFHTIVTVNIGLKNVLRVGTSIR